MPPRVQGVQGAGPGPQEAFMALPPVTRYWLASSLLATAACSFGYLSAWSLALDWVGIVQRFEVWRLFTPFIFFGTFDFNFAITMFRMYQYSRMYEVNPFNSGGGGSSADYMYMMLLGGAALFACAKVFGNMLFLGEGLLCMVTYVWSRKNPTAVVNVFTFSMQALYLPWGMMAFHLVTGRSVWSDILGAGVGHLYYFMLDIAPTQLDIDYIQTPGWLCGIFGGVAAPPPGRAPPGRAAPAAAPRGGAHQWGGGGRALGGAN